MNKQQLGYCLGWFGLIGIILACILIFLLITRQHQPLPLLLLPIVEQTARLLGNFGV